MERLPWAPDATEMPPQVQSFPVFGLSIQNLGIACFLMRSIVKLKKNIRDILGYNDMVS